MENASTILWMMSKSVTSVQDAVYLAAEQVLEAFCQGTFPVGGILMDTSGNVIHQLHNNVVSNKIIYDPTAHGERQLLDWYFENKENLDLPEPKDIILVTSLDPCVMCAGAILEAGIGAVIIAATDTNAGINYDLTATFPSLSGTTMQEIAMSRFSYPAGSGINCFSREASGVPVPDIFGENSIINNQTLALTSTAFDANVSVASGANLSDLEESELIDPKTLPADHPIYIALKELYPHTLEYTAPSPGIPDEGLAPYLIEAVKQDLENGGKGNAVAYLDNFGNLLLCMPGNQGASPIQTPFMLVTRAYAQLRYNLQMESVTDTIQYLGHPIYGAFIYAKGIEIDPGGLMDLGSFGSTMNINLPSDREQFQYVVERASRTEIQALCDNLPPMYSSKLNVQIKQVVNQNLIDALQAGLPK